MEPANGARRTTIKDVAAHAGVSIAAVSKVLRNAYGVSPAMRTRVHESMTELSYRPHAAARGMRGRTFTIGVLMPSIRNPFFADLLEGIDAGLRNTQYAVLIGSSETNVNEQLKLLHAMVDRQMDGLVLIAPFVSRAEVEATAAAVPTVVIGHHDTSPSFDTVVNDEAAGAAQVVDHLVKLGHRRIALASGPVGKRWKLPPQALVTAGFRKAMARHKLTSEAQVVLTGFTEPGGYAGAMRLLTAANPPTAIFAGADVAALGVFRAANDLGKSVPADFSLAGYNNTAIAALAPVSLTSVDQDGRAMGRTAVRLLLERLDDDRTDSVFVVNEPKLVARATTGPPPD